MLKCTKCTKPCGAQVESLTSFSACTSKAFGNDAGKVNHVHAHSLNVKAKGCSCSGRERVRWEMRRGRDSEHQRNIASMKFHVTSAPKHTAGLRRFAIGRLFAILQQLQQGISPKFPLLPTHRHPHSLNHTCAHPLAHKLTSRQHINPSTPTHQHPHTRIPAQAVLADFRGRGGKTASSVSLSQRVCLACENTTVCRHASHVYACLTCLYMLALPRPPSRRHI